MSGSSTDKHAGRDSGSADGIPPLDAGAERFHGGPVFSTAFASVSGSSTDENIPLLSGSDRPAVEELANESSCSEKWNPYVAALATVSGRCVYCDKPSVSLACDLCEQLRTVFNSPPPDDMFVHRVRLYMADSCRPASLHEMD